MSDKRHICGICLRGFASKAAQKQHRSAAHEQIKSEVNFNWPSDPVDSSGQWVTCDRFTGRKSFGFFLCCCSKTWISAHAQPIFTQGCQACEVKSFPHLMWRNDENDERDSRDRDEVSDKPHDSSRCGACRENCCRVVRRDY